MNAILVRFVKIRTWEITCEEFGIKATLEADSYPEAVEKFRRFVTELHNRGMNNKEICPATVS